MKMQKTLNTDGTIKEYKIGMHLQIHRHVYFPGDWFLTCRVLKIERFKIGTEKSTETELLKSVQQKLLIHKKNVNILLGTIENNLNK